MYTNYLRLCCLCAFCLFLAACTSGAPVATDAPPTSDTAAEQPSDIPLTSRPTERPTARAQPTTDIPPATLEAELSATLAAGLPPTATPDQTGSTFGGFEGVAVLPLAFEGNNRSLWAAFSYGFRTMDDSHFLAIYTYDEDGWQELDRFDLASSDYVDQAGVQQIELVPERAWIEVQSGAGAHSGVYNLLSFDGTTLRSEVEGVSASPGAGQLQDINNDGVSEVILNASNPYIFCYACGVSEVDYQVMRWDDGAMSRVALTPLPRSAAAELRQVMDEAIALAEAGLWQEAEMLARRAEELNAEEQNPTATWNIALIMLTARGRAEEARNGAYPLLDSLFYGDYTAITGILSGYSAQELFSQPNPLIVGTPAEGFEEQLITSITDYTTRTLEVRPQLATAYFLRGWASYLQNPQSNEALADVQRAAELEPDLPLFASSAEYLSSAQPEGAQPDDSQAIVAAARAYMQQRTGSAAETMITIEKLEGDYARVTIAPVEGSSDPLIAFLQRENGVWNVITDAEGPTPDIEGDVYRDLGIPDKLWNDLRDPDLTDSAPISDTSQQAP